jgi:hypothetical protein
MLMRVLELSVADLIAIHNSPRVKRLAPKKLHHARYTGP